ncbi:armadillo-type protein [Lipomyces japonicus]|uniref:armadillo-type protein n=1 Tax=Lipomyces japonicus TaxID=56871 RepID=UPI0034CDE91C
MISEDDLRPFLRASNKGVQLNALRRLKNSVIGHSDQKALYLDRGVQEDLLAIISGSGHEDSSQVAEDCRVQAAIVLGSFARSESEISRRLLTDSTLSTLVDVLSPATNVLLLLATLRTLTTLLTARPIPTLVDRFPNLPQALAALVIHHSVLFFKSKHESQRDTLVLSQACTLVPLVAPSHSSTLLLAPYLTPPLVELVHATVLLNNAANSAASSKLQSTAILALAHVITKDAAEKLAREAPNFINTLIGLLRGASKDTRLSAASLLASFLRNSSSNLTNNVALVLVPTLMKLLDDAIADHDGGRNCDPRILHTLAIVCADGGVVSDRCIEAGLIKKIVSVIALVVPNGPFANEEADAKLLAGGLLCLSALGQHKDNYRKSIIDCGTLSIVVAVLSTGNKCSDPSFREVQIAACHVLRSLSRSVLLLRTSFVESGVVDGVVDLLSHRTEHDDDDDKVMLPVQGQEQEVPVDLAPSKQFGGEEQDLEVRSAAMAAICNLVLEFSPLRKPILDHEILPLIVEGARSDYAPLRLNSVWALKHMVYSDDMETRALVLDQVGFDLLIRLCQDDELQVQEQALDFIRNLISRSERFIDLLIANVGEAHLFDMLEQKLSLMSSSESFDAAGGVSGGSRVTGRYYSEIVIAALYILVHIAAGLDRHRAAVAEHEQLLRKIVQLMRHKRNEIRLACVWIIINLTWMEDRQIDSSSSTSTSSNVFSVATAAAAVSYITSSSSSSSISGEAVLAELYKRRAQVLVRLGIREQLENLKQDSVLDVREKTKTAIYQVDALVGNVLTSSAGNNYSEPQQQHGQSIESAVGKMMRLRRNTMNQTAMCK